MKKVLSLFLAFIFVIGVFVSVPISANAANIYDLTFELNEDGKSYFVSDCSYEATGEIVIPESYNGLPVTKIGKEAFFNIPHITAVHMPSTVTTIGEYAFWESAEIEVITGYENVSEIGKSAFQGCRNLKAPIFPKNVTAIGESVFAYCRSFESIEIPEYVTSIGDSAFCECIKAKTIKLHDGIKSIGIFAFSSCASLTEISLPKGLTKISESMFATCFSLKKINIPESVKTIEREAFSSCEALEEIVIVDGVKSIETYTFSNCKNLKTIVIPETVTRISGYAFLNCKSLEKVMFKGSRTQWNSIEIAPQENESLINANIVCAIEDKPITLSVPKVTSKNIANGIEVTWNAVANAESYTVYRRVYNESTKKYSGWSTLKTGYKGTSLVDKNVKFGTIYSYTVRAVNGDVRSSFKAATGTRVNVIPTVTISNVSNGVKVSWSKVENATGYTIYSSTYNAKTKKWGGWVNRGTVKAGTTSWTDKTVKSGVYYKYTVRACKGSFKSSYKASDKVWFLAQPTVTVKAVSNGVKVSWTQSSGVKGYTVYRSEYNSATKKWSGWKNMGTTGKDKKTWTDKSAKKGVIYKYTVRAVNGNYKSAFKASNSVKR